jgi:hypothetical protein
MFEYKLQEVKWQLMRESRERSAGTLPESGVAATGKVAIIFHPPLNLPPAQRDQRISAGSISPPRHPLRVSALAAGFSPKAGRNLFGGWALRAWALGLRPNRLISNGNFSRN